MNEEFDTRTYIDGAGVERWADDHKVIDQKTVFRTAYDGQRIDTAKMAQAARNSVGTSRAVSRDAANGKPRGTLRGISQKADANLKLGVPDVYAGKRPIPSNWASVKRERA